MKELENKNQDKVVIEEQQHVKKLTQIDQLIVKPGHKAWQLNLETGVISEAEFKEGEFVPQEQKYLYGHKGLPIKVGGYVKKNLVVKKEHLYCGALNKKTAKKTFIKNFNVNPHAIII